MAANIILGVFVSPIALYVGLRLGLSATQDPHEPRLSKLASHSSVLYGALLPKNHIYTLRMPFIRQYIINSPSMIHHAQRQIDQLTFGPVALDFGFLFSGLNKQSQAILREKYEHGNAFVTTINIQLRQGYSLNVMTSAAIQTLKTNLSSLGNPDSHITGLYSIVRSQVLISLTDAFYGPHNPFRDPKLRDDWAEFLPGIKMLLFSPLPSITARRALQARARIAAAMTAFVQNGHHLSASPLVREGFEINIGYGLPFSEIGKMEIATLLALLSSGAITTFWMLYHIFSDPAVLAQLREEILDNLTEDGTFNSARRTIKLFNLRSKCPILHSTLQETFRVHSSVQSAKTVTQDTSVDGYVFKKGGIVMIPGPVLHKNATIWGEDAENFNHQRFSAAASTPRTKNDVTPSSIGTSTFRPFGSGATMCPGRHFSMNVILSIAAMMILQFDVVPITETWAMPTTKQADLWNAMPKPDYDVDVQLLPREGQFDFIWQ
ncbi:cytochrome P450 [Dendryphion nanum]|uniref:Cytochrome P450 n=1 Tax=Dendryphion nanum TaxID=256645 RepID=A0A9P9DXW0_9PLEO|nr:cytochrome P450 [Dendryphion nanum]